MRAVPIKIYQKGYTLIELMVAVAILGLGITGSLFLLNQTLRNTSVVKNNFIATYLASEGIELVRNMRDTNWRNGKVLEDGGVNDWRFGLQVQMSSPCLPANDCGMDFNDAALMAGQAIAFLKFDPSTGGKYYYDVGLNTIFKREISVEDLTAPFSIKVISTISWTEKGIPKLRVIEEHLYNWKEPQ
jgi:prepilin-type N-terminal cleavage/methylation domain-containing protein